MGGDDTAALLRDTDSAAPISVLCIGPDSETAETLAAALETNADSLRVEPARGARAGLDRLGAASFDCVVTSYEFPEMTGLDLFEAVRDRDSTVPVLLYDTGESEQSVEEALAAGVSGYVASGEPAVLANRIETEVRRQREQLRAQQTMESLEAVRDGIAIFDSDGQFQYVNEAYASFYGYCPEDLVGGGWEQLYPEQEIEYYRTEIVPMLQAEGSWVGECECLHRDGFQFRSMHSITNLEDGGHVCVIHNGSVRASEC